MASTDTTTRGLCDTIQRNYSGCDVSDALLKLHVHAAGFLPDLAPLRSAHHRPRRIVAPVSTAVLAPNSWTDASSFPPHLPPTSNIPKGQNWTDSPAAGTIVLVQQPSEHISAIFGDIMVTRLQRRGILGAVADGRIRDVGSCTEICHTDPAIQVWSKGISAAAPSLEARPWAVDIPLQVGETWVKPGDILCLDEEDQAIVVIPQDRLQAVCELLPILKEASDGVLKDVQDGLNLPEAVKRHPKFYSNYK